MDPLAKYMARSRGAQKWLPLCGIAVFYDPKPTRASIFLKYGHLRLCILYNTYFAYYTVSLYFTTCLSFSAYRCLGLKGPSGSISQIHGRIPRCPKMAATVRNGRFLRPETNSRRGFKMWPHWSCIIYNTYSTYYTASL